MKITGLSHLFKWENLHNWWLTKYFFAPLYVCPRSGEGCPLKNNDAVKLFLAVLLSNYLNLYVYLYLIGPQLKIINESTPFNLLTLLSCPCQCRIHG